MIYRTRLRALVATAALLAAVSGCGDDEEDPGSERSADAPTRTVTVPAETAPQEREQEQERGREPTGTAPSEQKTETEPASPEDQPGGAGDEEPARSQVVLTGRGGRIGPLLVKVPPFVSIRVILRSGDGKPYLIRFGKRVLKAGLKGARPSATFDGLRPGRRLTGAAVSGRVVIEASAEPGP